MKDIGYSLVNVRLSEIASIAATQYIGQDVIIDSLNLSNRKTLSKSVLSYCTSEKYLKTAVDNPCIKALVTSEDLYRLLTDSQKKNLSFILSSNPEPLFYNIFIKLTKSHYPKKNFESNIKKVNRLQGSIIEDGVIIGDNVTIGYNSVIKSGTIIGNNVVIGNCTVVGGEGYQLIKDENGRNMTIPHVGGVRIGNNVSIGDNTSIARSLFEGFTEVGAYSKIDNQVHIAHNCIIGENCAVIANVVLFGSCELKENVWVAPTSSVMNQVVVEKNAYIGATTLVNKDVPEGWTMVGIPAHRLEK